MIKTTVPKFPPVDILFYAHDGRGLGHISRSVAIGLAVRRLYPELRLLLVTGGSQTQELIGAGPLDWLKLPAYQTEVVDGKSRGIDGKSVYSDQHLGVIRGDHIRQMIKLYRPRVVLADHSPQGKHKELLPSLQDSEINNNTRWLLGVRGVVGSVKQTSSSLAVDLFKQYYSGLLWYGDSEILGTAHCHGLNTQFSTKAEECGYVSRLTEVEKYNLDQVKRDSRFHCTISVPWAGEQTNRFLELLASLLKTADEEGGAFRIFFGSDISLGVRERFECLNCCRVDHFGSNYLETLKRSQTAIIFGGYNSLVDVMAAGIPALVVLRNMQDQEQQQHLSALVDKLPESLLAVEEHECISSSSLLDTKLSALFAAAGGSSDNHGVNLSGAENAARFLASSLKAGRSRQA